MKGLKLLISNISHQVMELEERIAANEKNIKQLKAIKNATVITVQGADGSVRHDRRSPEDFERFHSTVKNFEKQNERMRTELALLRRLSKQCRFV